MSISGWMDRTFYPKHENNWDDKLFRERVMAYLDEGKILLDLGAGAGIVEEMNFKGKVREVHGVDLDPRVTDNPYLDEGKVSDASKLPYPENFFDIVISDNVMEHIEYPDDVFAEIKRVLKCGGHFLFKTPNKFHYMPLISRITPHAFHRFYNKLRGRMGEDTFKTQYKVNSKGDVISLAKRHGFEVVNIQLIEGRPEYLRISPILYVLGLIYERLVNSSKIFAPFRILLVADLRKPEVK